MSQIDQNIWCFESLQDLSTLLSVSKARFQDLSTLLAVSKASMIPYRKASFSKKAIHRWVRVEVG